MSTLELTPAAFNAADVDSWIMRWFDDAFAPMALVTPTLEVLRANQAAVHFAATSADIGLRDGAFFCRRRENLERFRNIGEKASSQRTTASLFGDSVVIARRLASDGPIMLFLKNQDTLEAIDCELLELPFGVTQAEWQILMLTVKGMAPSEIATQQGNSLHTIRTHMKRIYAKLGVQTKEQLFSKLIDLLLALRQTR